MKKIRRKLFAIAVIVCIFGLTFSSAISQSKKKKSNSKTSSAKSTTSKTKTSGFTFDNWQEFTANAGNFSVLMPGTPQFFESEISHPLTPPTKQMSWGVENSNLGISYGVMSMGTCPPFQSSEIQLGILIQGVKDAREPLSNLQGISIPIVDENGKTIGSHPGIAYERRHYGGKIVYMQETVALTRYYSNVVVYKDEFIEKESSILEREDFLKSFKITLTSTYKIEDAGVKVILPLGLTVRTSNQNSMVVLEDCQCLVTSPK